MSASLARQNALLLAAVFIVFELLMAAAVVWLLMLPVARRSAEDIGGLMVLAAQTWSELPPQTRPDFERELAQAHLLSLRAELPPAGVDEWHGPYLYIVESVLAEKTGRLQHLSRETIRGETWYWIALPSGETSIAVGFPESRLGAQPIRTLLISAIAGVLLAMLAAVWLARRTVGPLARLEQAVAEVGRGELPELLPETGPRELATLARRFNQMARQVRELLAARTTLLAGVSHDLRTPLARLRLETELSVPDAEAREHMVADIAQVDTIIDKFLDYARPDHVSLQALPLAALAQAAAQPFASRDDMQVQIDVPPELRVMGDEVELSRVLANLLENARRYGKSADSGIARVRIAATAREHGVTLRVRDHGPGVPEEQLAILTRPFFRGDTARTEATGAGLGLSIVAKMVRHMGGELTLANSPSGGLMAVIRLQPAPDARPAPSTTRKRRG